jgi:hypothetical protein
MKPDLTKIITTFTLCEFINEAIESDDVVATLNQFAEECELLGGSKRMFMDSAIRELDACRLLEQEGGAAPIANSVAAGGIAGMKPEDLAIPVEAQKRHTSTNSIFKRKKPNTYFKDKDNSY